MSGPKRCWVWRPLRIPLGVQVDEAGLDLEAVSAWLQGHVGGLVPPFTGKLLAGGRSNLTFKITDETGRAVVLRRPPLGHILESAHDMGREFRIISALQPTAVPVAGALGYCDDVAVNGSPFYVMELIEGVVLNGLADGLAYPEAARTPAARSLVNALAALHAVDPDAVGLGELSRRRDGYLERQLRRWHKQFHDSKTRELPIIDEVHAALAASAPPQRWTGIVHGDYRLGNVMLGPDGELRAVLDWELATLGDTMADIGWLVSYWTEPGEVGRPPADAPTAAPGFPTRATVAGWYATVTGRDLSDLPFYVAFARWRLACIGEGVLARYLAGVMGADGADVGALATSVVDNAEAARSELRA
jgi:aminoglycoside phosphotransferase (APT) family kinase protein